jgi:D-alanyl-D-alanine endopeptidase (penicillin-binding protein 7)
MKLASILLTLTSILAVASAHAGPSQALYDLELDQYQVANNVQEIRPMASITKLFTAITLLRRGVDLEELVPVQGSSRGHFTRGMRVSRLNLMKAMLISSDNLAAETLALTYPGGMSEFLQDANAYARGVGMLHTRLVDSSGLGVGNQTTAAELVTFLARIQHNPVLAAIAAERHEQLRIPKGRKKLTINLRNTNPSLFHFDNIVLSKTGFTNPAGRCVVMLVEKQGRRYAIVILGQRNIQERSRIADTLITADPLVRPPAIPKQPEPFEFNFVF